MGTWGKFRMRNKLHYSSCALKNLRGEKDAHAIRVFCSEFRGGLAALFRCSNYRHQFFWIGMPVAGHRTAVVGSTFALGWGDGIVRFSTHEFERPRAKGPAVRPAQGTALGRSGETQSIGIDPTGQPFGERLARWAVRSLRRSQLPRAVPWAGRTERPFGAGGMLPLSMIIVEALLEMNAVLRGQSQQL
jgi:hypothetical protein